MLARLFLLAFFPLVFTSASDRLPEVGKLEAVVTIANQTEGPIQLLGMKPPEKLGQKPLLQLRNISGRTVARFWLEAHIRGTGGKITLVQDTYYGANREEEPVIPPGSEFWTSYGPVTGSWLAWNAKQLGSNCVRASIYLLSVEFADDTKWHVSPEQRADALNHSFPLEPQDACKAASASAQQLDEMKAPGYAPVHGLQPNLVFSSNTSLEFTCSLRRVRGDLFAFCDM